MSHKPPELNGYLNMGWSEDLKAWGVTVSIWHNPCTEEWAFYYKHSDGDFHVAKCYEEQADVHRKYHIPIPEPGEGIKETLMGRQLSLM